MAESCLSIAMEAKGAGIRARVKWIEQGERSTKYFLGLEKNSVRKKEIKQLKSQNGKRTIRKQEEIIKEVRRFYAQLYNNESKNVEEIKKYVFTQNINQLSNDDKEICDGLLTVDECKHAIFTMKKNKSPGCDGISIEFYQTFWPQIKDILVSALNECYVTGMMCNTQRRGLITLLFKKGDSQNLNNWRPITLLNCDYKIIAFILASRLQKVITSLVNETQTGYIKGRLSFTNVRLAAYPLELNLYSSIIRVNLIRVACINEYKGRKLHANMLCIHYWVHTKPRRARRA